MDLLVLLLQHYRFTHIIGPKEKYFKSLFPRARYIPHNSGPLHTRFLEVFSRILAIRHIALTIKYFLIYFPSVLQAVLSRP